MTATPQTIQIEDLSFEITPLPFKTSRRVFLLLGRTIGPALVDILSQAGSIEALLQVNPRQLGRALDALLASLDDATVDVLFLEFGKYTTLLEDGASPIFHEPVQERVFRGRVLISLQYLKACVEVNYADFFSAGASLRAAVQDAPKA